MLAAEQRDAQLWPKPSKQSWPDWWRWLIMISLLPMALVKADHGGKHDCSPWASPIVLVEKDGTVRFCVDYRKVNSVTKLDAYPMPRIEEVLESIGSAK